MITAAMMLFLIFTSWLTSQFFLFIPFHIINLFQHGFWYIFIGFLVIVVSWLIGE